MLLASVSIDLDEIPCYTAIHGLPPPAGERAHAVYRKALPRFEWLLDTLGVPATFFAIGRDLEDGQARDALARLHRRGHEIGNHTLSHRYDFTRLSDAEIRNEIEGGADAIERAVGERPLGFRSPGYTMTDAVFAQLEALGASYDSSVFPCPAYYTAKTAAIGAIAARGRRSHSILGDPRMLRAPADPYRVGRPFYRRGHGLLELPIGVTHGVSGRLPYIGTFVVAGGQRGADWLTRRVVGRPFVNLELHGIDLADAEEDDLGFLRPHQPDLRRDLETKRRALETAIWILRGAGYEFVTLDEAAARFDAVI